MIALVDYGAGNLTSVRKALAAVGASVWSPGAPDELARADGLIVPGVGNFKATAALGPAWRDAILRAVRAGRPLLGICLGMQWLYAGSTEAPGLPGLGLLPGLCSRLGDPTPPGPTMAPDHNRLKVPHVGWNTVEIRQPGSILAGIPDGAYVYFTHSYAAPITDATAAVTAYGRSFASVVATDRLAGVQFHPEKSSDAGLRILTNFLEAARA